MYYSIQIAKYAIGCGIYNQQYSCVVVMHCEWGIWVMRSLISNCPRHSVIVNAVARAFVGADSGTNYILKQLIIWWLIFEHMFSAWQPTIVTSI